MRSARPRTSASLLAGIVVLISACTAKQSDVNIRFIPTWGDQPITCNHGPRALSDLRFFVSELSVADSEGKLHPVVLSEDGRWQQANVALVDLEDGEGTCANGTPGVHPTIVGKADVAEIAGLQFTVGVPFELNHANPLTAVPPLDDGAMHWHWRSGYKFLRAGVIAESDGSWIHLGSTACEGTVRNIRSCRSPNRVTVVLPDYTSTGQIAVDLSILFGRVNLDDGQRTDCSSAPGESECAGMFSALGLPFGEQEPGADTVFRVLR